MKYCMGRFKWIYPETTPCRKMRRELMESKNGIESALANLIQLSSEKGFLVFDDIYDVADKWDLSIRDVDYLSSSIAARGILVYDEAPVTNAAGSSSEGDYDDYAQRDYEVVFNRVIELDPGLEDFINTVRAVVPPQVHEMDQLKYQVQEGNLYARERVIQMHLRFAVRIALQRAETYDSEITDTLQEACLGLIMAVDRYDPDSSGPFGSYASLWILQNIGRAQATQRPAVYYPVHKKEGYFIMYPILKENGYLNSDIWTDPDVRRLIQDRLGCGVDQVEDIINQSMPIESLDNIYEMFLKNIEKEDIQEDVFQNINSDIFYWNDDIYEEIEQRALRETLENLMGALKDREREVLKARYGFEDGVEKTLEEVGQTFGVTRERIRQIESKALRKLSHPTRTRKLKDFL